MNIYQEVLNALKAEAQGILEQAGYRANSLTICIKLVPGEGWSFEALAAKQGNAVRAQLVKPIQAVTAQQFLDLLRERVATPKLQTA